MDGSTIFYIVLGIATLIFQIYKEKKKKEGLRQSGEHVNAQPPAEDFFDFFNRPEARERVRQEYQEDFSSETSADENILDKPGPAPVFLENSTLGNGGGGESEICRIHPVSPIRQSSMTLITERVSEQLINLFRLRQLRKITIPKSLLFLLTQNYS